MSTIIKCTPRHFPSARPSDMWRFIAEDRGGVRAEEWTDVNKMTAEERAEYEAAEGDEEPQFAAAADAYYASYKHPLFRTLEFAERWAALIDEEETAQEEVSAFGAPRECLTLVKRSIQQRVDELLKQELANN